MSHRAKLVVLTVITLLAYALRMIDLAGPVLRWDEGWTVAHASLPWPELVWISASEWHPPLYYALMKLWLALGPTTFNVRYVSTLLGTLAVPVAYHVGRLWDGRPRTGVFAALLCAWAPLLVYYGQVARMYPLATLLVLVAAVFLLRLVRPACASLVNDVLGLGLATFAAAFTQYYAVWPLAALYLYGLIVNPRRVVALLGAGLSGVLLYLPWLLYAYPALSARLATGGERGVSPLAATLARMPAAFNALLFYLGANWTAPATLGLIVALGLAVGLRRRSDLVRLSLPLLATAMPVAGIAYGAQASGWAAPHRHIMLTALLALLAVAWALERLAVRARVLPAMALVLVVAAYWPTSAGYVYAKNLEVVDPFDPGIDQAYLHAHARGDELAFFNVLARAGWYENRRLPGDPPWSYAMRWDPIVEPLDVVSARVERAALAYPRLWFVMHEGAYGPNAALVDWLDAHLYPAGAEWRTDPPMTHTLYLAYVAPSGGWAERDTPRTVGPATLARAHYTATAAPGGALAAELAWTAAEPVPEDDTVYVHWLDEGGALVAQHDGVPGAGRRPTSGWAPGEVVLDRHGARLPAGWQGHLRVVVGWYNPITGAPVGEPVEIGQVEVR